MAADVTFHPYARADLFDLYSYIEEQSGAVRAGGYLDRIEAFCSSLSTMPQRGVARGDLGEGVRTITLDRRLLVAYRLASNQVEILRVLYAGRDFRGDDIPD